MQVGIPRAMSFFENYPFFFGFFTDLGIEIVLSDKTTKKTLSNGAALVVTETCLPVKVFVGHVLNLIDKGIDKIFVPSFQSIGPKIYNCSKIRGLPDLVRNVVKREFTIIEATFDKSEKNQGFYEFLKETVAHFGITDKKRIKKASKMGWKVYNNFKVMTASGMDYKQAMNYALQGKVFITKEDREYPISIALVSHAYNIYDERTSMKIFDKLKDMDVKVYSAMQLTTEQMDEGINALNQILYWANEREMTGCAGHYLKDNKIDGVITLTAFGCGPDSLMLERITRKSKQFNKPLLNLTIDEHTGEAGFITRLEAFVDMLYRKKRAKILTKINMGEEEYIPNTNFIQVDNKINTKS
jgi:predicted nucleotide-binding protein (sugar kinase/HSP70/actin superfamily)